MLFYFFRRPLTVQQEGTTRLNIVDNFIAFHHIRRIMASHKVCLCNIVRRFDGLISETQVRYCNSARLLRVVLEIRLNKFIRMISDNFNGVFIGTNRTVTAETPELATDRPLRCRIRSRLLFQRMIRNIIYNADRKIRFGLFCFKIFIYSKDALRRCIFGAETIPPADDFGMKAFHCKRSNYVKVQRFSEGTRFLRSVKYRNLLRSCRNRLKQFVRTKWPVKTNLDKTHFFTFGHHVVNNFFRYITDRSHCNDNTIRIWSAIIIEQFIIGSDFGINLIHIIFHNFGKRFVIFVASLSVLEENISVFSTAAQGRMFRIQSSLAERCQSILVNHRSKLIIIPCFNFLDFVRSPETIEEVQKRNSSFDCRKMYYRTEIHNFLRICTCHHRKTGLAACIYVGMISENIQRMRSNTSCGYMDHARQQFSGNFIHIWDHQK